ncbi:dipeptidase AC. Metallo peptidase. MEROPS family M19 [Sulfitobacter brevis]|uniref:Dipeptidase AC. Metallo peptidase. MEROPS family M19 n=1 Tax=Sulfitobacter brevis TaxID=74348 RepID=A0A1I2E270_9RHOB|nr:membrane dipeptidase [Sulfitobacter brevis]SFE86668.1 dipeptidase AC. Metallo peptidase. MEROPS family M19 [Sulfitobacter brevis]
MTQTPAIFDGHNDFLLRLLRDPENRARTWLEGDGKGHLDLPRMKAGGFAGGFFAIYISSDDMPAEIDDLMGSPPYKVPLPALIDATKAQPVALAMAGHLLWMERAAEGQFKICHSVAEIRDCMEKGIVAAIMHIEGAEAIGPDLDALYAFHAMGLRSLGPVWSRPTVFGHGVPFAFPSSPDTGAGLTEAGRDLVRACNELRIMVDLSHLNEAGFNDVTKLSNAPLIATHSNAHALSASSRNLTDRQLAMIRESDGMVGVNFAVGFLAEDGRKAEDIGFDPILRHLDYLMEQLGENRVGFGSDFDGAAVPTALGDGAGLCGLRDAMRGHGYDENLMVKLCHENWLGALERSWGR